MLVSQLKRKDETKWSSDILARRAPPSAAVCGWCCAGPRPAGLFVSGCRVSRGFLQFLHPTWSHLDACDDVIILPKRKSFATSVAVCPSLASSRLRKNGPSIVGNPVDVFVEFVLAVLSLSSNFSLGCGHCVFCRAACAKAGSGGRA